MTSMIGYLNDLSKVNSYLYIGSAGAFNKDKLREHGITLVINCAREVPLMNVPEVEVVKLGLYFFDFIFILIVKYNIGCSDG